MAEKAQTVSLKDLTIEELVQYEKASAVICQKYENSLRQYDGSISSYDNEYGNFDRLNNIRCRILDEMEERLRGLK